MILSFSQFLRESTEFSNLVQISEGFNERTKQIQQALKAKGPQYASLLGTDGPNRDGVDGEMGNSTISAIKKFQSNNGLDPDGVVGPLTAAKLGLTSDSKPGSEPTGSLPASGYNKTGKYSDELGYIAGFAFPEYEPKVDGESGLWDKFLHAVTSGEQKGTYGKFGHGGVVTITPAGKVTMFEFGRYPGHKEGYGITREKKVNAPKPIIDLQASSPTYMQIKNIDQIMKAAKSTTYPPGPNMKMDYVYFSVSKIDNAIAFAKQSVSNPLKYEISDFRIDDDDANCGTFALQTIAKAGVNVPAACFPSPGMMIKELSVMDGASSGVA